MSYSYDDGCYDLARHFMFDEKDPTEAEIKDLAQAIQDVVEDWLNQRAHYRGEER